MRVLAPALALALALVGCIAPAQTESLSTVPLVDDATLFVFDALGQAAALPEELAGGFTLVEKLLGHRGGEPNVGVDMDGNVFMTANHNTMRSQDAGATWEIVFNLTEALPQYDCPPGLPQAPLVGTCQRPFRSSDPMLWVDQVTGRVFTNHMTGLYCSNMIISDDAGESWTMKPMTCGIPVNDHQKVATGIGYGPASPVPTNPVYPNPVYYCYNKLVGTHCAVSFDGGLNFPVDRAVTTLVDGCGGINGHPAPHPDGTMFVPIAWGCDAPYVGVSEDSGLTWTLKKGPENGGNEIDPEITVTPDGTAYMLWRADDNLQYLARSTDKFDTWEGPWKVSPPDVRSSVFAGLTSGDDGRIAFAFLGTRDTDADPSEAENETRWYMYVGYSLDAASENPTFAVRQATPDDNPVQIGCVWLGGGGNPCRNMLDFIDMASDPAGRIYVAYTDGCISAAQLPEDFQDAAPEKDCAGNPEATNEESRGRNSAVVMLGEGPLLRVG